MRRATGAGAGIAAQALRRRPEVRGRHVATAEWRKEPSGTGKSLQEWKKALQNGKRSRQRRPLNTLPMRHQPAATRRRCKRKSL